MEIQTLLGHVYKAKFLRNSRVFNAGNKNLVRVLWPLCICPAYVLILLQVSNHYLETVGEAVFQTNFLSISRVHNSTIDNLFKVL